MLLAIKGLFPWCQNLRGSRTVTRVPDRVAVAVDNVNGGTLAAV